MSLTRRRFVENAAISLVAGVTIPSALAQSRSKTFTKAATIENSDPFTSANLVAFNNVSMQTFVPLIGESFRVSSDQGSLGSMILLSVSRMSQSGNAPARPAATGTKPMLTGRVPKPSGSLMTAFALQFQGAAAAHPQGTYIIYNAGVGTMPLLLVPSALGVSPPTCTAIFNLLES